mgnify:CR=1 FL=1
MLKKILIGVALVVLALVVLGAVKALQIRTMIAAGEEQRMPPTTVTSATVERQTWEQALSAVGSVTAAEGTELKAEASGVVVRIAFESGDVVERGKLLVELDTETEQAQLKAARARLDLARLDLERAESLRQSRTISKSEFDSALARYQEAEAEVENIRSLIDDKTLRAPFAGRTGIRQVNPGSFVNVGEPLVALQSLAPIYVDFSLPQQVVSELEAGLSVEARVDSFPERVFRGRLTATSPQLDRRTRTLEVQATFDNAGELLRPGMFVKVRVLKPEPREVLAVPAAAILHAPYGDSVFVIEKADDGAERRADGDSRGAGAADSAAGSGGAEELVIRQRFVRTGAMRGDFIEVQSGLDAGQRIAGSGVFKLRNGSRVVVDNSLALDNELNPTPEEG